ncbi:hypothetical protein IF1G_02113 [Cordyceps javanica]|uniref:Uncharacterized protein n=1 Tax=Cordyceps javanica TaxID=43265 RepID=A0A545VDV9_9HYPO|nr:hypothetical protein IF1G_02113 [Cordyceps javanica]
MHVWPPADSRSIIFFFLICSLLFPHFLYYHATGKPFEPFVLDAVSTVRYRLTALLYQIHQSSSRQLICSVPFLVDHNLTTFACRGTLPVAHCREIFLRSPLSFPLIGLLLIRLRTLMTSHLCDRTRFLAIKEIQAMNSLRPLTRQPPDRIG